MILYLLKGRRFMRFEQLKYLIELSNTHSFSIAAENLFTTQPNISNGIKSLEKELNISLFQRNKNETTLTPVSKEILVHAKEILYHVNEITAIAKKQNTAQKSNEYTLNIEVCPAITEWFSTRIIPTLLVRYPNCKVKLLENSPNFILESIKKNNLNIDFSIFPVITTSEKISYEFSDETIKKIHRLFAVKTYCLVSKKNPYAQKKSISLKQISELPLGVMINTDLYDKNNNSTNIVLDLDNCNIVFSSNNKIALLEQVALDNCVSLTNKLFDYPSAEIVAIPVIPSNSCVLFAAYQTESSKIEIINYLIDILTNLKNIE